jgi:hypothetical protein
MAAFPTPLRQPPINRIGPGYSGRWGQLLFQVLRNRQPRASNLLCQTITTRPQRPTFDPSRRR